MNAARYLPLGLVAVLLGGCTYPEFDFGAGGAGAAAGPVAGVADTATSTSTGLIGGGGRPTTGSTVTSGGVTSSSVTSSSATTAASSSATGGGLCVVTHPGGGTCEYLPDKECGCDSSKKCSVAKEDTGEAQCINRGTLQQGQVCSSDTNCAEGFWCDHFTDTCERICDVSADCNGGVCTPAPNATISASIPGLLICTANCNPVTGQACGSGATCALDPSLKVFDCFKSSDNKTAGQSCAASKDCSKGLACLVSGICAQWCITVNDCPTGKTKCSPVIKVGTTTYGVCE